jgi:drug/metabolite transporter (DMT)-like permease
VLTAPARETTILLALGVAGVSTAAPLIKTISAPPLAVAFWRLAIASCLVLVFALLRRRAELASFERHELRMAGLAGVFLAAHFATFIWSLSLTTVASAVVLVVMQPVWAALFARWRGETIPRTAWTGVALCLLGVVLLSGVDLDVSRDALLGDALALLGGILAAGYRILGAEVRQTRSTTAYTCVCYPVAAALSLIACLVARQPLGGYATDTWLRFGALALLAQLLGHSVFSQALKTTSPTMVSLALTFEVLGATALAAVFLGETPPLSALPATASMLLGVVTVVSSGQRHPSVTGMPPVE